MLFNFQTFVSELRENPEKKEVVEKFEKFYWPISWETTDQNRFTEYVNDFSTIDYKIPEELAADFNWELLMKLVAASFSSDGLLEVNEGESLPEFLISVQSGEQVVVKKISELRWFQILRLYEIYAEEQMNLQILIAEDEKEKDAILAQRESRQKRRQLVLDNLEKKHLEKEHEAQKSEELDSLYGQL